MLPIKDDIPTKRTPIVTIAFIVINCLVFLFEFVQGSRGFMEFTYVWGLIPVELTTGVELTPQASVSSLVNLLTSMFMHGGLLHLGGNMLYLWIFGNNIEDRLGRVKFILFYLASGIVASMAFVATAPQGDIPLVGASGAIAGILGAYLISYPRARVVTVLFIFYFIRIARIPAMYVLGFWFILQVFNGLPALGSSGGGVAWFAHIGGFLFGLVVFKFFVKKIPTIYLAVR